MGRQGVCELRCVCCLVVFECVWRSTDCLVLQDKVFALLSCNRTASDTLSCPSLPYCAVLCFAAPFSCRAVINHLSSPSSTNKGAAAHLGPCVDAAARHRAATGNPLDPPLGAQLHNDGNHLRSHAGRLCALSPHAARQGAPMGAVCRPRIRF